MSHSKVLSDGIERCSWVTEDQIYIDYHDHEWGTETKGQQQLFEGISLEGFQAGLSWLTILKRRDGFRSAFDGFRPEIVARFDGKKLAELANEEGIIRNRAKIASVVNNARVIVERGLDLTELMWSFAPAIARTDTKNFEWRAVSAESEALSKELKRLGFSFVGPTTMYALMQSSGMIFDHAPKCFRSN